MSDRRESRRARQDALKHAVDVAHRGSPEDIIELLESPERPVRIHAATTIARRRVASAAPDLRRLVVGEPDTDARVTMALALTILDDPGTGETFHKLLDDESDSVRRLALRGLSQLGDPTAIELGPRLYATGSRFMRQETLDALGTLGTPEADEVLRSLRDAEPSWRWRRRIDKALRSSSEAAATRTRP